MVEYIQRTEFCKISVDERSLLLRADKISVHTSVAKGLFLRRKDGMNFRTVGRFLLYRCPEFVHVSTRPPAGSPDESNKLDDLESVRPVFCCRMCFSLKSRISWESNMSWHGRSEQEMENSKLSGSTVRRVVRYLNLEPLVMPRSSST